MSYMYKGKRTLDLIISTGALILISPILLVIAIIICSSFGSPIFFSQRRPGLYGKPFTILKFRTMKNIYDAKGEPLSDSERLTPLGRFLRSTSIDEIPELLNVIRGEMSLVGPRPLLMQYLQRYTPEQMRRHEVKPGITGWAQVNGRNAITWEEKFALDVWYVDNISLWLDIRILAMTVWKVIRREGITQGNQATVEYFQGK